MYQDQEEPIKYVKKVICKLSDEDMKEMTDLRTEKQAIGEAMQQAINTCTENIKDVSNRIGKKWDEIFAKHGIEPSQHVGVDPNTSELFMMIDESQSATADALILTRTDPDSIPVDNTETPQ